MPVAIVETVSGVTSSGTATATIATALEPDDLVVCITSTYGISTAGAVTPSGIGTWSAVAGGIDGTTTYGIQVSTLTGVTGGGNVSITVGSTSSSYAANYVILVVTGLAATVVSVESFITVALLTASGVYRLGLLNARAQSLTLAIASGLTNYTFAMPVGWEADSTTGRLGVFHRIEEHDAQVSADVEYSSISVTSSRGSGLLLSIGGPLESRHHTHSIEAALGGDGATPSSAISSVSADAILANAERPGSATYGVYSEAVFVDSDSQASSSLTTSEVLHGIPEDAEAIRSVRNSGVDVVSRAMPTVFASAVGVDVLSPARAAQAYSASLEVLRRYVPPGAPRFRGWGIPL